MTRKQQQAELIFQLGVLLGPALKVAANPESYDIDERTRVRARFAKEVTSFKDKLFKYVGDEPGHSYTSEYVVVSGRLDHVGYELARFSEPKLTVVLDRLTKYQEEILQAILTIPVPVDSAIHEARTPFSTYCLVKDLCSTTKSRILWMDRYFDQSLFHRYLADTPLSTQITLVTWPESKWTSPRDRQRYAAFLDVSRLFAQERGHPAYRLVTDEQFHDRWLRCDGKLYTLGGSIKDLGKDTTFTISKLDSTPDNERHFDEPLMRGTELFGGTQTTHL